MADVYCRGYGDEIFESICFLHLYRSSCERLHHLSEIVDQVLRVFSDTFTRIMNDQTVRLLVQPRVDVEFLLLPLVFTSFLANSALLAHFSSCEI